MSSPFNNIDSKIELAVKEIITEASWWSTYSATYDALPGITDGAFDKNGIVCFAESAEERSNLSGIWVVRINVEVRTNVDPTNAASTHRTLLARVRDLFLDSDLPATLDATEQDIRTSGVSAFRTGQNVEDRFLVGSVSFDVCVSGY